METSETSAPKKVKLMTPSSLKQVSELHKVHLVRRVADCILKNDLEPVKVYEQNAELLNLVTTAIEKGHGAELLKSVKRSCTKFKS